MKGLLYSSDQEFFINGVQLSGVQSVQGRYQIPTEQNNFLGHVGPVNLIQNAPGVANFQVSKLMITSDEEITDLIGDASFNGGLVYNEKQLGFRSGCLSSYAVSFAIDQIPSTEFGISVYGNMGSGLSPKTGVQVTGDHFVVGYDSTWLDVGLKPEVVLKIGDMVRFEELNFDYQSCPSSSPQIDWNNKNYEVRKVLANDYGLAAKASFLHGQNTADNCGGQYLNGGLLSRVNTGTFMPASSGISVECDGGSSNRVTDFSYSVDINKKPIYRIGSYEPCQIMSMKPIKANVSFRLEVDDYETKAVYDSIKTGIHKKDIKIRVRDRCDHNKSITYELDNARLLSESFFTNNNNETIANLEYESYSNTAPVVEYEELRTHYFQAAGEYHFSCEEMPIGIVFDGEPGTSATLWFGDQGASPLGEEGDPIDPSQLPVIIKNEQGFFVWGDGGGDEHLFTYAGETITRTVGVCEFRVRFDGFGSLKFSLFAVAAVLGSEGWHVGDSYSSYNFKSVPSKGYNACTHAWPDLFKITTDPCRTPKTLEIGYSFIKKGTSSSHPLDPVTDVRRLSDEDSQWRMPFDKVESISGVKPDGTVVYYSTLDDWSQDIGKAFKVWKDVFEYIYPWLTLKFTDLGEETLTNIKSFGFLAADPHSVDEEMPYSMPAWQPGGLGSSDLPNIDGHIYRLDDWVFTNSDGETSKVGDFRIGVHYGPQTYSAGSYLAHTRSLLVHPGTRAVEEVQTYEDSDRVVIGLDGEPMTKTVIVTGETLEDWSDFRKSYLDAKVTKWFGQTGFPFGDVHFNGGTHGGEIGAKESKIKWVTDDYFKSQEVSAAQTTEYIKNTWGIEAGVGMNNFTKPTRIQRAFYDGNTHEFQTYSILHTAVHELGHGFGLRHALPMNPISASGSGIYSIMAAYKADEYMQEAHKAGRPLEKPTDRAFVRYRKRVINLDEGGVRRPDELFYDDFRSSFQTKWPNGFLSGGGKADGLAHYSNYYEIAAIQAIYGDSSCVGKNLCDCYDDIPLTIPATATCSVVPTCTPTPTPTFTIHDCPPITPPSITETPITPSECNANGKAWKEIWDITTSPCRSEGTVDISYSFIKSGTRAYDNGEFRTLEDNEFQAVSHEQFTGEIGESLQEWKNAFEYSYPWLTLNFINKGDETNNKYSSCDGWYYYDLPEDVGDLRFGMLKEGDGAGGYLAYALPPQGKLGISGNFGGDVHYDGSENWRLDASNPGVDYLGYSIKYTTVHELGHAFGLGHSLSSVPAGGAIMKAGSSPSYNYDDLFPKGISEAAGGLDLKCIQDVYGCTGTSCPPPTRTCTPSPTETPGFPECVSDDPEYIASYMKLHVDTFDGIFIGEPMHMAGVPSICNFVADHVASMGINVFFMYHVESDSQHLIDDYFNTVGPRKGTAVYCRLRDHLKETWQGLYSQFKYWDLDFPWMSQGNVFAERYMKVIEACVRGGVGVEAVGMPNKGAELGLLASEEALAHAADVINTYLGSDTGWENDRFAIYALESYSKNAQRTDFASNPKGINDRIFKDGLVSSPEKRLNFPSFDFATPWAAQDGKSMWADAYFDLATDETHLEYPLLDTHLGAWRESPCICLVETEDIVWGDPATQGEQDNRNNFRILVNDYLSDSSTVWLNYDCRTIVPTNPPTCTITETPMTITRTDCPDGSTRECIDYYNGNPCIEGVPDCMCNCIPFTPTAPTTSYPGTAPTPTVTLTPTITLTPTVTPTPTPTPTPTLTAYPITPTAPTTSYPGTAPTPTVTLTATETSS